MDLGLAGKVAMVAASSKGMGRATAMGLASEGCAVSICARDAAELGSTAEAIRRNTGGRVPAVPPDLRDGQAIERWAERTVAELGAVDILVANSGGPPLGTFEAFPDDAAWQAAFELNLLSTIRMVRAVVPSMRRRGGGRILAIQSSSVKQPIPGLVLSNSMRPGVVGLLKTLANELAPDNILVNVVAPGHIYTDRPRGGMAQRASYVAGTTVLVDGGLVGSLT
ncbi:MAG: SDR family NAD(P)-dependent oxidoreductase [Chloroflexi bacterium]|nr:SDR family NAD(P)-dependent oxidoreductase [Chloroflexota bacterium]